MPVFDGWLFLLVLTAIAIGWLLGTYRLGASKPESQRVSSQRYYKGLNYLLNDQSDGAIDAFLGALEVNDETIEMHLALGGLLRRRGEYERAIRIHRNLMSRATISKDQRHQVQYELAQDYLHAGWLDRAERLLLELNREAPADYKQVLGALISIYQQQQEWQQALAAVKQFSRTHRGRECTKTLTAGAHYCCEMAQESLREKDYRGVRQALREALRLDKNCVRASLLSGEVELATGHPELALRALKRIAQQDMERVPDAVPLLTKAFTATGAAREIVAFLERCSAKEQSPALICCLYEQLKLHSDPGRAAEYLRTAVSQHPSLLSITRYIEVELANADGSAHSSLANIEALLRQLEQHQPGYQCTQCGFQGQQLHWLCPGCRSWGSVKMASALLNPA